MTRVEKTIRELSDLRDFYVKIKRLRGRPATPSAAPNCKAPSGTEPTERRHGPSGSTETPP